jgi:hypothetical protein
MDRMHKILRYYDERNIPYHLAVDVPDEIVAQWAKDEAKEELKDHL